MRLNVGWRSTLEHLGGGGGGLGEGGGDDGGGSDGGDGDGGGGEGDGTERTLDRKSSIDDDWRGLGWACGASSEELGVRCSEFRVYLARCEVCGKLRVRWHGVQWPGGWG